MEEERQRDRGSVDRLLHWPSPQSDKKKKPQPQPNHGGMRGGQVRKLQILPEKKKHRCFLASNKNRKKNSDDFQNKAFTMSRKQNEK